MLPPLETPPRNEPKRPVKRKATAERFQTLNMFTMRELSRAELAMWLVLYRDTRDGTARTSAEDIARRSGMAKRRVTKALAELRRRGLIEQLFRGGINSGPSRYRVIPWQESPD